MRVPRGFIKSIARLSSAPKRDADAPRLRGQPRRAARSARATTRRRAPGGASSATVDGAPASDNYHAMTEPSLLERLRASSPPRDAALCRTLAARLEPAWGFVAYGVLWLFVAAGVSVAPLIGFIVILNAIMTEKARVTSSWVGPAGMVIMLFGFALAWWPFAWWARRRRRRAGALFRDGQFVDGTVESMSRIYLRGAEVTRARVALTVDGLAGHAILSIAGHPTVLGNDGVIPMIVLRGYRYCGAFAIAGALTPGSLHVG
jgi:hypothetical protein